jgi:hypothetical protein
MADLNRDGIVTIAEVDAYVSLRMPELLAQWSGAKEQHPTCGRPVTVPSCLALVNCQPVGNVVAPSTTAPAVYQQLNPQADAVPSLVTTGPII